MIEADGELISRAVQGDQDALSRLLESCSPRLANSMASRIGGSWRPALDLEDVMQVTLLEAFLRIEQCRAREMGSFMAWLTRIAENNLRDAIRELEQARRRIPRAEPAPGANSSLDLFNLLTAASSSPSRQAGRDEIRVILDAAVQRLPPAYEQVVRLYDLDGRSASDVARALARSEGAVFMLRARAHDRLRELLGTESRFFSDGP
ncbi:MAG TPA: RNA polymerase sigma factor [Phycisphaerae bacterium]|nr:RNA polymerase sigma factor [Phycisphaerae bacterium]HRY70665.1 RNA polymerase sigma factor [Phycisphaerae bacterium]HSA28740.1 RNA polymerase sigma factor [Phycisphaerae bacterium]